MCGKRKAAPAASASSPNKKTKGKASASSSAPSSSNGTPSRPKPKAYNNARPGPASKRRAATPSDSSYDENSSEDQLDSDDEDPKDIDESDGSWAEEDTTSKKGKGKKRANPGKPSARPAGRSGGAGRGRTKGGAAHSAPATPVSQVKMIGDQIDPLYELVEADSDASMDSWNEEDRDGWEEQTAKILDRDPNPVAHILRFRHHPRRQFPQYRVIWLNMPIYGSTWEEETIFDVGQDPTDPTLADMFWARQPGGRPADAPRPPPGEPKHIITYSDTDVQDFFELDPERKRHKRRKIRDAWRMDKYQYRKLKRSQVETAVRAAQAAAFEAGDPVPVLESEEEDDLAGEKLKRSPSKPAPTRAPKSPIAKKATPQRGSSSKESATQQSESVIRTRTQAGLQIKPSAKGSASAKEKPRPSASKKAGPLSRINGANKASGSSQPMPHIRSYITEPDVIVIDDSSDDERAARSSASPKKNAVVNSASTTKGREPAKSSAKEAQHVTSGTSGSSASSAVPAPESARVSSTIPSASTAAQPQAASASASTSTIVLNAVQATASSAAVGTTSGSTPAAATSTSAQHLKVENDVAQALFREASVDDALGLGQMYQTPALQHALRAAMQMADAIVAAEISGGAAASTATSQAAEPHPSSVPKQTIAGQPRPDTAGASVASTSARDASDASQSDQRAVSSGAPANKGNEADAAANSENLAQASESRDSRVAQTAADSNDNNNDIDNDDDDDNSLFAGTATATPRLSSPVPQKMEQPDEEMNVPVKVEPSAARNEQPSANAVQNASSNIPEDLDQDVKPKLELLKAEPQHDSADEQMALDNQATESASSLPIEPQPIEDPTENEDSRENQLELSPEPEEVDEEDDVDMDLGLASATPAVEPVPTPEAITPPRAAEPTEPTATARLSPPTDSNTISKPVMVEEAADVTMADDGDLWGDDSDEMDSAEVDRQIDNVKVNPANGEAKDATAPTSPRGVKRGNMAMTAEDEELPDWLRKVPSLGPSASGLRRPTGIPGAAAMSSRIGAGPPPQPIPSNTSQMHLNKAVPLVNGNSTAARPIAPPLQAVAPAPSIDPADLWAADSMEDGNAQSVPSTAPVGAQAAPPLLQTAVPSTADLADLWAADEPPSQPAASSTPHNVMNGQGQTPAALSSATHTASSMAPLPNSTTNDYSSFEAIAKGWEDDEPAAPTPASGTGVASSWGSTPAPVTNKAPVPPPANSSTSAAAAWGTASSTAIDNDLAADLWGADDGGLDSQPAASSGGWGDPATAINRNAPPSTGGQGRQWTGGQGGGGGQNGHGNGPQGQNNGSSRWVDDNRPPARSPNTTHGGAAWGSVNNASRSPADQNSGWGSGMNSSRSPTTNTGGTWGSQPTSAQTQPSNWGTSYSGPANNDRRVSSGGWGTQGHDATGAGGGASYADRGGRGGGGGGFRGGRGGFNSNNMQSNPTRTPPGGGGGVVWGSGNWNNGGRTPGPTTTYPGNNNGGRTPGGRTPGSGKTTPGKASSGGRTPGGPSNWGAGPSESVSMPISIDAGNAPQQYVHQAPLPGHQAQAHMQMMQQQQQQLLQQQQLQQQQMLVQMQQQVIPIQTPTIDLRQQLTPYQQKRFDKWFNDSESENKLGVAHDATKAVLHFSVNDEMVKKIQSSYVFIFKDSGGMESKLAHNMVKVCKGGLRQVLDFKDEPFWTKDALVFIWRHAQDKLLTSTKPDAIAPFLNKAKRCSRLTFMVFGSEHPEVDERRSFDVVFPQNKKGGCLSFSVSGLLHHAYHAATHGKDLPGGTLPKLTVWKMATNPPKNWRVVVHPWLVAAIRRCVKEGWKTQLFNAISLEYSIESKFLVDLPDRIEKHIAEMDAADTACGYGVELPEYDSVAEMVLAVDKEVMASMHRTELNHWTDERFDVVLTEGGSLLKLDEEAKAGVEVLRMDDVREFLADPLSEAKPRV